MKSLIIDGQNLGGYLSNILTLHISLYPEYFGINLSKVDILNFNINYD